MIAELRDETWARVRAEVLSLEPRGDRETAARIRILAELDRLPLPFSREADPTHVTGSAIVTGMRGVVLHRHKLMNIWLQPGGHLDSGEHPAAAALREAREETGLQVAHPPGGARLCHLDVHDAPKGHVHLDLRYLLEASGEDPSPAAGESQEVRWFSWAEAIAIADPGLRWALVSLQPGVAREG